MKKKRVPFELHSIENNLTCVIMSESWEMKAFLSLKDLFLVLQSYIYYYKILAKEAKTDILSFCKYKNKSSKDFNEISDITQLSSKF